MQIVKSRIVIPIKRLFFLAPAALFTGCSFSPAIPVIGAYYPGWLFCMIASVILTLITRRIVLRKYTMPAFSGVIYTALFALYAMLIWLVLF